MKLDNGIISVEISELGAELKSVVKNGYEYMWCGDKKYWGRTSPVLFPFVGGLKDKKYRHEGKEYQMAQHGFARDSEFELIKSNDTSATYILKSNDETLLKYPFPFLFTVKYTLNDSALLVEWEVKNTGDKVMYFSIGAHPAFNLKDEENYFMFDNKNDMVYHLVDETGLFDPNNKFILKNDGYLKYESGMFDNDAYIIENNQAHEVSLCGADKKPYVTVRFKMPLFGLWSPEKKNAPFVCIEPWNGRCDRSGFDGELKERDYVISLDAGKVYREEYEMEFK